MMRKPFEREREYVCMYYVLIIMYVCTCMYVCMYMYVCVKYKVDILYLGLARS